MTQRNFIIKLTSSSPYLDTDLKNEQNKINELLDLLQMKYSIITEYKVEDFLNDLDKVYDFLELSKEEFLESYSYLSEDEYDYSYQIFMEDRPDYLANWLRDAENMLIEENTYFDNEDTNPYKCYSITGEELKDRVCSYALEELSKEDYEEFQEIAEGMAC